MGKVNQLWNRMFNHKSLDYLLAKSKHGITHLEEMCRDNELDFDDEVKRQILNSSEALYICAKNNCLKWLDFFDNEDIFFQRVTLDKILIEYILSNNVTLNDQFFLNFQKHHEVIDSIMKYQKDKMQLLPKELIISLFEEKNGSFLADNYLADLISVFTYLPNLIPIDTLLNYCDKKSNYNIFHISSEEWLLKETSSGKTLLEELLSRGVNYEIFGSNNLENSKTFNILIKNNRLDLFKYANPEALCMNYDEKNTYLDLLIANHEKNIELPFIASFDEIDVSKRAYILMKYAQNGHIDDIHNFSAAILLEKPENGQKSSMEYMIEMDRETVTSIILPKCKDVGALEITMQLRDLGLDVKPDIQLNAMISHAYAINYNSTYDIECGHEYDEILNELYELFINDSKSSPYIVEALVKSYRYYLSTGGQVALAEVKNLIAVKKQFPEKFVYVFDKKSFFDKDDGSVHVSSVSIPVINHETTHALHYYLNNNYIPEEYSEIASRVIINLESTKKLEEFIKLYQESDRLISVQFIDATVDEYYTGDRLLTIKGHLASTKEKQKEKYKDRYPDEVLDSLFDRSYTIERFIEQRKKLEEEEIKEHILRYQYGWIFATSDILDAVYGGKLFDLPIKDADGKIMYLPGHGIRYYEDYENRFKEILAQYGTIIKSKNSEYAIKFLRNIVGDELVDMVANFYKQMIMNPQFNISVQNEPKEYKVDPSELENIEPEERKNA